MDSTTDTPLDTSEPFRRRARYVVALVASALVALYVLWTTREALLLLFLGVAVGCLFYYSSRWLADTLGGPRSLWLGAILLALLGGIVAAAVFGGPTLVREGRQLVANAPEVVDQLEARFGLPDSTLEVPQALNELAGRALGLFNSFAGVLTGIVVVLIVGAFTAGSPETYIQGVARLVDRERQPYVRETLHQMGRALLGWTRGVGIAVALLTVLGVVGLTIIGVPGAIPLAIFAGALTAIPTFGPLVGWAPAVAVAFATDTTMGVWTLGLAIAAQQLEGNVVTPKVQGHMVSVAPAAILATQIVLGSLTGFLGILLAVPFAGVALIALQRFYIGPFVEREPADPDMRTPDVTPPDPEPAASA